MATQGVTAHLLRHLKWKRASATCEGRWWSSNPPMTNTWTGDKKAWQCYFSPTRPPTKKKKETLHAPTCDPTTLDAKFGMLSALWCHPPIDPMAWVSSSEPPHLAWLDAAWPWKAAMRHPSGWPSRMGVVKGKMSLMFLRQYSHRSHRENCGGPLGLGLETFQEPHSRELTYPRSGKSSTQKWLFAVICSFPGGYVKLRGSCQDYTPED